MQIKIKNPSMFKKIVKSLPKDRQICFTINQTSIKISSISVFYFYIIFDDVEIANFSKTIDFSISPEPLSKYLDYFSELTIIIEDMIRIHKQNMYVEIPFFESSRLSYVPQNFCCRLILRHSRFKILYLMKGKCRFIFENNELVVKKNCSDGYEELVIGGGFEVVRAGIVNITVDLYGFLCLKGLGERIESVVLSFNDDFVVVNPTFKNYDKLYYEVQVPRFVFENYYR